MATSCVEETPPTVAVSVMRESRIQKSIMRKSLSRVADGHDSRQVMPMLRVGIETTSQTKNSSHPAALKRY